MSDAVVEGRKGALRRGRRQLRGRSAELTYLLTYLLSHSRGTPLSHPHCPVGQLRSRVVGPEYVGHIQGFGWRGKGGAWWGGGGVGGTTTLLSRRSPCRHPCLLTFSCPPSLNSSSSVAALQLPKKTTPLRTMGRAYTCTREQIDTPGTRTSEIRCHAHSPRII